MLYVLTRFMKEKEKNFWERLKSDRGLMLLINEFIDREKGVREDVGRAL